ALSYFSGSHEFFFASFFVSRQRKKEHALAIFLVVLNFLCFFLCFKTKKEGTCPSHFSGSLEFSLLLSLCQDKERRLHLGHFSSSLEFSEFLDKES
ncbi:MAG: hypothetical protein K6T34_10925, partial [Thermoflavifilum sp.]|nr:hypothetical protein [Thermoflavifilum sp.]